MWLDRFFEPAPGSATRLPVAVENWLRRHARPESGVLAPNRVLTREKGGERLSLRHFAGTHGAASMLVLELDTPASATAPLRRAGLTEREIDVLRQVEHGRTNIEIAAKLGISAQTVRAHLEHIFRKLGVTNRTAAVTEMRQRCNQ
jgi:DNA-binding CsgD family transcriptional regulator